MDTARLLVWRGTSSGAGLELVLVTVQGRARMGDGFLLPFSNIVDQGLSANVSAARGHPQDNRRNNIMKVYWGCFIH